MAANLNLLIGAELDKNKSLKQINTMLEELSKNSALNNLRLELNIGQAQIFSIIEGQTKSLVSALANLGGQFSFIASAIYTLDQSMSGVANRITTITGTLHGMTQEIARAAAEWERLVTQPDASGMGGADKSAVDKAGDSSSDSAEKWNERMNDIFNDVENNSAVIDGLINSLSSLGLSFSALNWLSTIYTGTTLSAKVAVVALQSVMTLGLTAAISGIIAGMTYLIGSYGEAKRQQKEYFETLAKEIEQDNEKIKKLEELKQKYNELGISQESQRSVLESMAKLVPEVISHYDKHGNAVYKSKLEIDKLIESQKELNSLKQETQINGQAIQLKDSASEMDRARKTIRKQSASYNYSQAEVEALEFANQFINENKLAQLDQFSAEYKSKIETLNKEIKEIFTRHDSYAADHFLGGKLLEFNGNLDVAAETARTKLGLLEMVFQTEKGKLDQGIKDFANSFQLINGNFLQEAGSEDANLAMLLDRFAQAFAKSKDITKKNYLETLGEFRSYSKSIVQTFQENKIDLGELVETGNLDQLFEVLKKSKLPAEAASLVMRSYKDSLAGASKETERMKEAQEELKASGNSMIAKVASDLKQLDSVIQQVAQGQTLSSATVLELTQLYPDELNDKIIQTANGMSLQESALIKLRKAIIDHAREQLKNQTLSTTATYNNVLARLKMYGIEIQALDKVEDRNKAIAELEKKKLPLPTSPFSSGDQKTGPFGLFMPFVIDKVKEYNAQIQDTQDQVKDTGKIVDDFFSMINNFEKSYSQYGGGSKSSSSSSSKVSEPEYKPSLNLSRAEEEIKAYNRLLEDNQRRIDDAIAKGKPYSSLLKNRIQIYRDLSTAMTKLQSTQLKEQNDLKVKLNKLGLVDDSGQIRDNLSDRLLKLSKGKAGDRLNLSMDQIEKMVTDFVGLKDKVNQTKQELSQLTEDIVQAIGTNLRQIQAAGSGKRDAIGRRISLMGEINTQEELQALNGYTERIISSLKEDQKKVWNEIVKLKGIMKDPKATPEMKSAAEKGLSDYLNEANKLNLEMVQKNEELGKSQAESIVFGFNKRIEDLEFERSLLGDTEEDKKKAEELNEQIKQTTLDARTRLNAQIVELQRKLNTDLDAAERLRAQTKLEVLQKSDRQYQLSLSNMAKEEERRRQDQIKARESQADAIIANYKKMLEKEQKLRQDAIAKEKEEENERHSKRMEHLDEEMRKFEENMQAQMKALDRQSSEEDYKDALGKLDKERQAIEDKLNVLALDDSFESKAKQKELQEQLEQKREEINKYERDHERSERKQEMQDRLEERKRTIDQEKRLETDTHKETLNNIDLRQQEYARHYEELLTNEKLFYTMKQNLLSEDSATVLSQIGEIQSAYTNFFKTIAENSKDYGKQIAANLKYAFGQDENALKDYKAPFEERNNVVLNDWKKYLANKKEYEAQGTTVARRLELKRENTDLRDRNKFKDGSFEELSKSSGPLFTADTGGVTPSFAGSKFLLAHEKEMVLNKLDTSNLLQTIQISRDLASPLRKAAVNLLPAAQSAANSAKSALGTVIEKLYIEVSGKFSQPTGEDVGTSIINSLRRKGITFA